MSRAVSLSSHDLAPFFGPSYDTLAERLTAEALAPLSMGAAPPNPRSGLLTSDHDAAWTARAMGSLGLYAYLVPEAHGGAAIDGRRRDRVDVRSLVLVREALGQVSPLADAIFAVQGLGSYPLVLAGSDAQRRRVLPDVIRGERIGAFALTEPEAGSDVAAIRTTARRDGDGWVLDGEKTLISNVPIAHHHVVFANADPARGRKGITAFLVERDAPGLSLSEIPMSIPHPIGRLRLEGCRVPGDALVGEAGAGFKLAMETLDAFRISVGAAANGMARSALAASIEHVTRRQFGAPLADQQMVRAAIADMATELDAARLLVARAAHLRDTRGPARASPPRRRWRRCTPPRRRSASSTAPCSSTAAPASASGPRSSGSTARSGRSGSTRGRRRSRSSSSRRGCSIPRRRRGGAHLERAGSSRASARAASSVGRRRRECYARPMRSTASKQRILDALNTLPEDASIEDAIERLYFLAKTEKGLAQLDAGQSLDHEEVKRRVGL